MNMRKQPLLINEYYHIYNRGVDKRKIFEDLTDIERFVESANVFNQIEGIGSLANLRKSNQIELKALSKPLVAIVVYCLNPNHFHFILKQLEDNGIAKFMQKLQAGYTYYFNIKNSRSGSLFQGTYKSQIISNEKYFNKIIGYVNKNYQIHNIPKNKKELVFASDYEYENNNFKLVSKKEAKRILDIYGGVVGFKKHSEEIIKILKKEREDNSLLGND